MLCVVEDQHRSKAFLGGMSDEGKFKLNVVMNASLVVAVLGGFFSIWTTLVQKYDSIVIEDKTILERIEGLQRGNTDLSSQITDAQRRIEAQGQHLILDEQRINETDGKIDTIMNVVHELLLIHRNNTSAIAGPSPSRSGH